MPGATGANVQERKTRDSAKTASLTLEEMELYLLSVLNEYMNTPHSSLGGLTPLQKWRSCFFEDGVQVRELPEEPSNLEQLRIELLPFKMLTLQAYGVVWDLIKYDSDELVAMRHRHAREKGRTFTVRRDPRDISRTYIWDPDNKRYLTVPYRHAQGPPMSIWELRAVRADLKARGIKAYTELTIFDAYNVRRKRLALLEEAQKLTRKAQRDNQRRLSQNTAIAREKAVIAAAAPTSPAATTPIARDRPAPHEPTSRAFSLTPAAPIVEPDDDYDDLDI